MSVRLIELAIRANRQTGRDHSQFSFRLAFVIDLIYMGLGALGGAALGRAATPTLPGGDQSPPPAACAQALPQRLH